MARFDIRLDPLWRGPLLVIGATPSRSYVELSDDELEIRFGRYQERIARTSIADAAPRKWPWFYGIGVRIAPDAIGYVGSYKHVVQIDLLEPQRFRILFGLRTESRGVAVSLEDPEGFLDALGLPA